MILSSSITCQSNQITLARLKKALQAVTKRKEALAMKKVTINYILWYFSHFNRELYIEYNKLFDIVYFYNEELHEVLKALEYAEEHITIEQINNLYFEEFFSYTYYGTHTRALDLTGFLDYAVKNLPAFRNDITDEL